MKKLLLGIFVLVATACNQDPETINFGKDNCSFCKMTIMDEKFATECISKKGKTFMFDDLHCMIHFIKNGGVWSNEIGKLYIADYTNTGKWIEADKAFILKSDSFKSPMGGNYAAFATEEQRESMNRQVNGQKLLWNELMPVK